MTLALSHCKSNSKAINLVNTLNSKRHMFAAYIIDQTEGSCGQRGSVRAEQNHSSLMSFSGEEYTGELEDILTKLLLRQKNKSSETHQLLTRQSYKMQVIHRNLITENKHPILIQASNILSEWGFNKFRKYSYAPLNEYMCMSNPSGCTLVYKKDVDQETKTDLHTFKPYQRRCECDYSKCYQIQCVHELSKYGRLMPEFSPRDGYAEMETQNQHTLDLIRTLLLVNL